MFTDDTRKKIENITRGIIIEGEHDYCTTLRNILCRSYPTSTTVKENFESKSIVKEEQAQIILDFCKQNNLWVSEAPQSDCYLAQGGEARVYFLETDISVIKLNDAIYYATWLEFLTSILLHNVIFDNTKYTLLGFLQDFDKLYAVLKQPFIKCDSQVDLGDIKAFLEYNGFVNTMRQDYVHHKLGLILEDMHDENVLVFMDTLFFIDTVFYTVLPC